MTHSNIKAVLTGTLLFFFIFVFHLPLPHAPGSGLWLPGNLMTWAFMALISLMICLASIGIRKPISILSFSPLSQQMGLATVLSGIPLLYTPSTWLVSGIVQWLGIVGGFIFYFCLVQGRLRFSHHQLLLVGLASAALIEAVVGALYLLVWLPGPAEWYVQGNEVSGILLQQNIASTFLMTGLGAAMLLWLDPPCREAQSKFTHRIVRVLPPITMIIVPFTLIFLQSRIGLLSCSVLVVCISLLYFRTSRGRCAAALAFVLSGVLVANALVLFAPTGALDFTHEASTSYRLQMLLETAEMIAQHPFQGWGLGSFSYQYAHFLISSGIASKESVIVQHPHNEWLFGWAEGGLLTVLAYLVLLIAGWKLWCQARRRDRMHKTTYRRALWILLLPALLHTQVEYPFYLSAVLWMTFLMLLAMLDGVSYGCCRVPNGRPALPVLKEGDIVPLSPSEWQVLVPKATLKKWAVIPGALALTAIVFMITGLQSSLVLTSLEGAQTTLPAAAVTRIDMDRVQQKLWNPWIYNQRLEFDRQLQNLLQFNVTRDPRLLNAYLRWSAGYLANHVNPDVFASRMMILQAMGQRTQAQRLRYEAHLLYPQDIRFRFHYQGPTS